MSITPSTTTPAPPSAQSLQTWAIVSVVLGFLSLPLLACCSLGFPVGVAATAIAAVTRARSKGTAPAARTLSTVGLCAGALGATLGLILVMKMIADLVGSWIYATSP